MVTELFDLARESHLVDPNFRVNGRGYKPDRWGAHENNLCLYLGETFLVHGWDTRYNWRIIPT